MLEGSREIAAGGGGGVEAGALLGTRLDLGRGGPLGGESLKSMAVAGRIGGVRPGEGPGCNLALAVPGDAVCALGGGGGGFGAAASAPA